MFIKKKQNGEDRSIDLFIIIDQKISIENNVSVQTGVAAEGSCAYIGIGKLIIRWSLLICASMLLTIHSYFFPFRSYYLLMFTASSSVHAYYVSEFCVSNVSITIQ